MIDENYTLNDHEFRDNDVYAAAKYEWTARQLRGTAKGSKLLNVGCGGGTYNRLAVGAGFLVTGIEPDLTAFEFAQRSSPVSVRMLNVGLEGFQSEESFDVVVVHDVLEHIEDDIHAVELLFKHLRPGGVLIGSVPALSMLFGLHDEKLGHFRRYSKKSISRLLRSRFKLTTIQYFGLTGIPIVAYYSCLRRIPYPTGTNDGMRSIAARLFGIICKAESRLWVPIGTSLLFVARK